MLFWLEPEHHFCQSGCHFQGSSLVPHLGSFWDSILLQLEPCCVPCDSVDLCKMLLWLEREQHFHQNGRHFWDSILGPHFGSSWASILLSLGPFWGLIWFSLGAHFASLGLHFGLSFGSSSRFVFESFCDPFEHPWDPFMKFSWRFL